MAAPGSAVGIRRVGVRADHSAVIYNKIDRLLHHACRLVCAVVCCLSRMPSCPVGMFSCGSLEPWCQKSMGSSLLDMDP